MDVFLSWHCRVVPTSQCRTVCWHWLQTADWTLSKLVLGVVTLRSSRSKEHNKHFLTSTCQLLLLLLTVIHLLHLLHQSLQLLYLQLSNKFIVLVLLCLQHFFGFLPANEEMKEEETGRRSGGHLRLGESFRQWTTPVESPTIIIGSVLLNEMWLSRAFFLVWYF